MYVSRQPNSKYSAEEGTYGKYATKIRIDYLRRDIFSFSIGKEEKKIHSQYDASKNL